MTTQSTIPANQGEVYLKNNDWSNGIIHFLTEYRETHSLASLENLAWCYSRNQQYKKSIDILKYLFAKKSDYKSAYMIGYQYQEYAPHNLDEAILWYEKSLSLFKNYLIAHYRLAKCLYKTNRLNEAEIHAKTCLDLIADKAASDKKVSAGSSFLLGKIAFERKQYDSAFYYFANSAKIETSVHTQYNIAKCYYYLEKYNDAIIALKGFKLPENEVPMLIRCNFMVGNFDDGLRLASRLKQKSDYVLYDLGASLKKNDLPTAAFAVFKYLEQHPSLDMMMHKIHYNLGLLLSDFSDYEKAKQHTLKAISLKEQMYKSQYYEAQNELSIIDSSSVASKPYQQDYYFGQIVNLRPDKGFGFLKWQQRDNIYFKIPRDSSLDRGHYLFFDVITSKDKPTAIIKNLERR